MWLESGTVATVVGILFGLNFIGLFVAAFLIDRDARHILFFVTSALFFFGTGVADVFATLVPDSYVWPFIVDAFHQSAIGAAALGFADEKIADFNRRILFALVFGGIGSEFLLAPYGTFSMARIIGVNAGHAALTLFIAVTLIRERRRLAGFVFAVLSFALTGFYLSIPALYLLLPGEGPLQEKRIEVIGLANPVFIAIIVTLASVLFFHVMRSLIIKVHRLSITDQMTGLLNRRGFFDAVVAAGCGTAALVMLDIDRFKSINDRFGHAEGDRTITAIAAVLAGAGDQRAIAARLGGEEFALFLPNTPLVAARLLAEALRVDIEHRMQDFLTPGESVTASFGVASVNGNIDAGIRLADQALYASKNAGRNRVSTANESLSLRDVA